MQYPNRDKYLHQLQEHQHAYYRFAYSFMGNEADAMDAVSQLAVTIIEKGGSLREEAAFPAWSRTVLANICRTRLKERSRREVPMELPLQLAGVADDTAAADERLLLRAALARLSAEHREVIALRFYQGLDYKDIAQTLDIAEGTVKSRLHRAISALKAEMEGGRHNVQTA